MTMYICGLLLFFIPHLFSTFRNRQDGRDIRKNFSEIKYMSLYSLITGIGFGLFVWGYVRIIDDHTLYFMPQTLHQLIFNKAWVIMFLAFTFIVAAYLPMGYIKKTLKHPMMIGVLMWALVHLSMGGTLKRVILFGSFTLYSLIFLIVAFNRERYFSKQISKTTIAYKYDFLSILIGLILLISLLHNGHSLLFKVSPI